MGFYTEDHDENTYGVDMDALVEAFLIDDLTHNYGEDAIHEFCSAGGAADALLEAKVLSNKRTVVRLDKQSDLARRKMITALAMAKASNAPEYNKLVKVQLLRKQLKAKILAKFGSRAAKLAVKGQKQYVKSMKNVSISNTMTGPSLTELRKAKLNKDVVTHDKNR